MRRPGCAGDSSSWPRCTRTVSFRSPRRTSPRWRARRGRRSTACSAKRRRLVSSRSRGAEPLCLRSMSCVPAVATVEVDVSGRKERKVVTVLFCDLVGSTAQAEEMDPEDVAALLAQFHARVKEELERFGGTVEEVIGEAVMALFGAPVAHEDDPERAVRAALAIREWAQEAGELQVRVGITTGEALVALTAQPQTGEGMASGDVVNTAARLQSNAPENGVLVDETTYRATRNSIEYGHVRAVEAKGKKHGVNGREG